MAAFRSFYATQAATYSRINLKITFHDTEFFSVCGLCYLLCKKNWYYIFALKKVDFWICEQLLLAANYCITLSMTVACPLQALNYEKEQVCKKYFWEKLHHTEYGVRMSSASTELGETTGMYDFFRELLHHAEYGHRMFSVCIELWKRRGL